jgi:hypothetical protein
MNIDIEKEILKEMSEVKKLDISVEEVVEKVQDVVEKVQEVVEKGLEDLKEVKDLVEEKGEELSKTVVRVVETAEFQKTFQCCLPFLSRFLEKKKPE